MRLWKSGAWILLAMVLCPGPAARRLLGSLPSVGPALGSHSPVGPSPRVGGSSMWGEKRQVCKNRKLMHKWHPEKVKVSKGLSLLKRCGTGLRKHNGRYRLPCLIGSIFHIGHSVYGGVGGFPWRSAVPQLYCYREAYSTSVNLLLLPIPTKGMPAAWVLLLLSQL